MTSRRVHWFDVDVVGTISIPTDTSMVSSLYIASTPSTSRKMALLRGTPLVSLPAAFGVAPLPTLPPCLAFLREASIVADGYGQQTALPLH